MVEPAVRPYDEADRSQVLALDTSLQVDVAVRVRREGDSFLVAAEPVDLPTVKRFDLSEDLDEAAWDKAWVAEDTRAVVAFAATRYEEWNRRQILLHLYVDRGARQLGVGRALVSEALTQARDNGADHLWLETSSANVSALRAYEAMGFRLCGLDQTLYDGTAHRGEVGLFMSWPIRPA